MSPEQNRKTLLLIAIAVISLNLRPAIAGVGPLIHEIRLDTGLSNTLLGMLTTLPLLAFGMISILTPIFTRRLGTEGTMAFALTLLTTGILLRVIPFSTALFTGTLIIGIGIALGNVLLPGIAKKYFPHKFGMVTGIYSAMLGAGASMGSGLSVPLSEGLYLGWRWALGVWALISLAALLLWLLRLKMNRQVRAGRSLISSMKHLGSSRLAWHIALFMGMQSLTFYVLVAWLPEILIDRGLSAVHAGWLLSLLLATGAVGTFLMPSWAARRMRQRLPVALIITGELIGLAALMMPTSFMVTFWVTVLGFSSGSSFGMALLFIGLRSRDTDAANQLSGMAQSVGYTIAATGPALFGAFYDWTHSWSFPLGFLVLVALIKLMAGWQAGKDDFV